ncbi:MAG: hypothetical protein VKL39_00615 [Leptolyngbyaceae bacterium]|nr:hypothetical protein [Leptolyngbyaceae bacterium]
MKIAGLDVGKTSVDVCVLSSDELTEVSELKDFARSYKPLKLKTRAEDIELLLSLEVDFYVLEPTGCYSYTWCDIFEKYDRAYKLASPTRVRNYAKYQGIINKSDRNDCVAITAYSLDNAHKSNAFLKAERVEIREMFLSLRSTVKSRNPLENRLGQRLGREVPELLKTFEQLYRSWLEPPSAMLFSLAGLPIEDRKDQYKSRREKMIANTIGIGITKHTRDMAEQLIRFQEMELGLEEQLEDELKTECYQPYIRVFNRFKMPKKIQAAILSRIYPIEDYLDEDAKPRIEYVISKTGKRSKRDRSEAAFKLSLGMGKILHQSGNKTSWKAGGAQYARTALWQYIKTIIVIQRRKSNQKDLIPILEEAYRPHPMTVIEGVMTSQPWENQPLINKLSEESGDTFEVSKLRLHYEFQPVGKKGDRRVSATAGKACRMLYKQLIQLPNTQLGRGH